MSFIPADYSVIEQKIKEQKEPSFWGGYYHPGVYGVTPSKNKLITGRILPAFNYALSQADTTFPTSWIPYRNVDNIDSQTNQPVFNAFFAVVAAYSWFGNKQVSFLSPSTKRYTHGITRGPEIADPIQDIRNYAKKHEDPAIRALTERQENKKDAKVIIPYPQRRYVFNFFGTAGQDRNTRNILVDVSQKAFEDLASKLSEWRPAHENILDPNWSNYLYGDITDPNTGLIVDTVSIPANPQPFNGFVFTPGSHKSLKGVKQSAVPLEALAGRYHLYGDASVFKFMSVQEIVDFLVEDGSIPYNLIQQVCSNYANVPPKPNATKVFTGDNAGDEEEDIPPFVPTVSMPKTESPRQVPPPAETVAVKPQEAPLYDEPRYWLMTDGVVQDDVTHSQSEVKNIITASVGKNIMVCPVETGVWQTCSEAGFKEPAKRAAPPPPPAAPPRPPVFNPPAGVVPSAPPPVQATDASASGLTPQEAEEFAELKAKFDNGTIAMQEMSKFVRLAAKTPN